MATTTKQFLDYTGLNAYDRLLKIWANSEEQIAYKKVLKSADSNSIYFYFDPEATLASTPDATISLGNADTNAQLEALAAIVPATYDSVHQTYSITGLDTTAKNTIVAAINELVDAIETLNGADTVVGSVAKSIKDAIAGLAVNEFALTAEDTTDYISIYGIKEENGRISRGSAKITLAKVAKTGSAADISVDNTQMTGTYTATNAQDLFEEVTQALANSTAAGVVTVEEDGESGSTLKSYRFYQGVLQGDTAQQKEAKRITTVNIPKDFLVKSASVETVTTADVPYPGAEVGDKYIDFVVNTKEGSGVADTHIYIPVDDLMAAISGGTTAEVTVSIDAHNVITATINKISASKIDYTANETVLQALTRIDGSESTTDSIREIVKNEYIATLDVVHSDNVGIASYNSTNTNITLKGGLIETNGIIANDSAADDIVIAPIDTLDINGLFTSANAGE